MASKQFMRVIQVIKMAEKEVTIPHEIQTVEKMEKTVDLAALHEHVYATDWQGPGDRIFIM